MKRDRNPVQAATLLSVLLLTGCAASLSHAAYHGPKPDGRYDNHVYLIDSTKMDLARVAESIVTLRTETLFETRDGVPIPVELTGSGLVVSDRFVLTVEHTVSQHEFHAVTPFGMVMLPVRKVAEKNFILWRGEKHPIRPIYRNRPDDVALFVLPQGVRPPSFPHPFGKSEDLRVGNFVYVVGNPMNLGVNVREGIVSALKAPRQISSIEAKSENAFMVSNGIVPGDSGTPIIAVRDGRFELVGLSQGTISTNTRLGWGIRIDVIRNLLRTARALPEETLTEPHRGAPILAESTGGEEIVGVFLRTGREVGILLSDFTSLRLFRSASGASARPEGTP